MAIARSMLGSALSLLLVLGPRILVLNTLQTSSFTQWPDNFLLSEYKKHFT